MTDGKWLSDAQLHIELLQCIARYQWRGIQVSDLLPAIPAHDLQALDDLRSQRVLPAFQPAIFFFGRNFQEQK